MKHRRPGPSEKIIEPDGGILDVLLKQSRGRLDVTYVDRSQDRAMLTLRATAIVGQRKQEADIAIDAIVELLDQRAQLRRPTWCAYRRAADLVVH